MSDLHSQSIASRPSASLFVALYLVILAFFILLNSISTIKRDEPPVTIAGDKGAISEAEIDYSTKLYSTDNSAGFDITLRNYASRIGDVVRDSVTLIEATVEESGNSTEVRIPADILFYDGEYVIRQEHRNFIDALAEELNKLQITARIDIEFVISASDDIAIDRASYFAETLIAKGTDAKSILVGIDAHIPDNQVRLRFYVRHLVENCC